MPPKKKEKNPESGVFTEVERTFLELQLADCNRKLARLRSAVEEYERRNEELQKSYDKLDEDRADIIAFLKKSLGTKNEENSELKDKIKGLEEIREIENAHFKETIAELQKNFNFMKDQLTSENKLLCGKLNTLDEFRALRDDLMKKYEKQEQDNKDQEMRYKRILYEAEKKFVIGKDKLKKEMEARLLQLAQDFQDATELRIAASTHRVIRENIAINNELDHILATQAKLAEQNEKFKDSERAARIARELAEEERDKAINKNVVQLKIINHLTSAFQNMKKQKALTEKKIIDVENLEANITKCTKENEYLALQVRILEQNLHAKLNEQTQAIVEAEKVIRENANLRMILKEAATAIQAALKMDEWADKDPTREKMNRQVLLSRLLDIVTQYREVQHGDSINTLLSMEKVYEKGDLGFVPKISKKRSATSVAVTVSSKEEIQIEKKSTMSFSGTSLRSIKTIPSIPIVPLCEEEHVEFKGSLLSFVTSNQSVISEVPESLEEDTIDSDSITKQIEKSKLEIQKSLMLDFANSQGQFGTNKSKQSLGSKRFDVGVDFEDTTSAADEVGHEGHEGHDYHEPHDGDDHEGHDGHGHEGHGHEGHGHEGHGHEGHEDHEDEESKKTSKVKNQVLGDGGDKNGASTDKTE